jgi:hypothetical protein
MSIPQGIWNLILIPALALFLSPRLKITYCDGLLGIGAVQSAKSTAAQQVGKSRNQIIIQSNHLSLDFVARAWGKYDQMAKLEFLTRLRIGSGMLQVHKELGSLRLNCQLPSALPRVFLPAENDVE